MREIVHAAACGVAYERANADGTIAFQVECPDVASKARLIHGLGLYDASEFADVIRLARTLVRPTLVDTARNVQLFCQRALRHQFEQGEVFPSTPQILSDGVGDCDDHAIVMVALLAAAGLESRVVAVWDGGLASHVCVQALCGLGAWYWCETTIAARLGEHPTHAATRTNTRSW